MSTLSIDLENFKRFAKRLQKEQKKLGFEQSLSQSQDLLAKTFGCANYHEFHIKFSQEEITEKSNIHKEYLYKLKELLSQKNSSIDKCLIVFDDYSKNYHLSIYNIEKDACSMINLNKDNKNLFSKLVKDFAIKDISMLEEITNEYIQNKAKKAGIYHIDETGFMDEDGKPIYITSDPYDSNFPLYVEAKKIFTSKNNTVILKYTLGDEEKIINGQYYRAFYASLKTRDCEKYLPNLPGYSNLENAETAMRRKTHDSILKVYLNCFDHTDYIKDEYLLEMF